MAQTSQAWFAFLRTSQWASVGVFVVMLLLTVAWGQSSVSYTNSPRLSLNGTAVQGDFVVVKYEINYPGFVELHLFNPAGEKVWITGEVNDEVGTHQVKIPRKPINKVEGRYQFFLRYKGQEYKNSFFNQVIKKEK